MARTIYGLCYRLAQKQSTYEYPCSHSPPDEGILLERMASTINEEVAWALVRDVIWQHGLAKAIGDVYGTIPGLAQVTYYFVPPLSSVYHLFASSHQYQQL
jgi:hypothetical protein